MLPVHRRLLERIRQSGPVRGVILDTPAAFQSNVHELSAQAEDFFSTSLRVEVTTLAWDDYRLPAARPEYLARLKSANFIFCGPGSPSYALREWSGTDVPEILRGLLWTGACIAFSSAAALTLGAATVPVYEIYKAGDDPYWLEGMDLLSALGLTVAVVPHFNNRSGQGFDTRCASWANGASTACWSSCPGTRAFWASTSTPPACSTGRAAPCRPWVGAK